MRKLAFYLTGFHSVLLGLLVFMTFRFFEIQALFEIYLPLVGIVKTLASHLISLIVVFTLLIFSSNIEKFKVNEYDSGNWIKWLLFLFTLLINAFFWRLWDGNNNAGDSKWLTILFKAFLVAFLGAFDFCYNHLFVAKWSDELRSSGLNLAVSQLKEEESKLTAKVSKLSANLKVLLARHDPKVCPRCGKEFDSVNQRNGHLRSCKEQLPELKEL